MKNTKQITLFFFCITTLCFSQQMQKGFTYLETGKYVEAEEFFTDVLEEYPKNKTAKLCYGRAVGLNGSAEKAVTIFTEMLETYPGDFEIELNYAESLLWSKQFSKAEVFYKTLITKNDQSFAALLGFANTLSNLKKYQGALEYVNKALEVIPENPNAMVSKKYIYLGMANQYVQEQKYTEAISTLLKDLKLFPDDKDILLNLGNTYTIAKKYKESEEVYRNLQKDSTLYFTAKNNLSLLAHLQEEDKNALLMSTQTLSEIDEQSVEKDIQGTQERYAQSLIWNGKYKKAKDYIEEIAIGKENKNWILALKATLYTYTGDFKSSLIQYHQILKNDDASFDGNLGKANALKANNQIANALDAADQTLVHFPNQKDAVNFIEQIKISYTPSLDTKVSHSFDNGNSKNDTYSLSLTLPISLKTSILSYFERKDAVNEESNIESTSTIANFGLSYQLFPKVKVVGLLGVNSIQGTTDGEKEDHKETNALIEFKTTPFKRQILDIGFKRETQNFNAQLLNEGIVQNSFFTNYNINTTFKLGWFTQYFYTFQNDDNVRNLLFTSLYYNLLKKPAIKGGVNFQYLSFAEQMPETYFSPSKFKAVELFVNLIKDKATAKNKELYYGLTAAYGYQYNEDDPKTDSYRIQTNLGFKFSEFSYLEAYYMLSSIAPVAAVDNLNGFEYNEFGIKFLWRFMEKPFFRSLQ